MSDAETIERRPFTPDIYSYTVISEGEMVAYGETREKAIQDLRDRIDWEPPDWAKRIVCNADLTEAAISIRFEVVPTSTELSFDQMYCREADWPLKWEMFDGVACSVREARVLRYLRARNANQERAQYWLAYESHMRNLEDRDD